MVVWWRFQQLVYCGRSASDLPPQKKKVLNKSKGQAGESTKDLQDTVFFHCAKMPKAKMPKASNVLLLYILLLAVTIANRPLFYKSFSTCFFCVSYMSLSSQSSIYTTEFNLWGKLQLYGRDLQLIRMAWWEGLNPIPAAQCNPSPLTSVV